MRPVVQVRGLVRRYTLKGVLDGVDLHIAPGEFVALLGRSGSGKSTLLRALAGLDHEATGSGEYIVPDRTSVVFQDARLLPWMTVIDNIVLGLDHAAGARGKAMLAKVGLAGRETAWPHELSGGEQQRVALARALVREPVLLLADEPFGALDAMTRNQMHLLLRRLYQAHDTAVLLVTHDIDEAILLSDRVIILEGGRISSEVSITTPRARRTGHDQQIRAELAGKLGSVDKGYPGQG